MTLLVLSIVGRRAQKARTSHHDAQQMYVMIGRRFAIAFAFGLIIAFCWEMRWEGVLPYLILLPLVIALFTAVHFPECLLGFVLSMAYTFGGVLPIGIGLVLLALAFVIHCGPRWLAALVRPTREQN